PWCSSQARECARDARAGAFTAHPPMRVIAAPVCEAWGMSLELTTTLAPRGPAAAIVLDDDQVAELGGGAKVFPVKVTINGTAAGLRLARMGGENMIGFSKAARKELGVEIGEEVHAVIERDDAPREVAIPDELQQALDADPAAKAAFERLSFTQR